MVPQYVQAWDAWNGTGSAVFLTASHKHIAQKRPMVSKSLLLTVKFLIGNIRRRQKNMDLLHHRELSRNNPANSSSDCGLISGLR